MNQIAELLSPENIAARPRRPDARRGCSKPSARCSRRMAASTRATIVVEPRRPREAGLDGPRPGHRDSPRPHQGIEAGARRVRAAAPADRVRRARRQARVAGVRAARARAGDRPSPAAPVRARADVLRARLPGQARHAPRRADGAAGAVRGLAGGRHDRLDDDRSASSSCSTTTASGWDCIGSAGGRAATASWPATPRSSRRSARSGT